MQATKINLSAFEQFAAASIAVPMATKAFKAGSKLDGKKLDAGMAEGANYVREIVGLMFTEGHIKADVKARWFALLSPTKTYEALENVRIMSREVYYAEYVARFPDNDAEAKTKAWDNVWSRAKKDAGAVLGADGKPLWIAPVKAKSQSKSATKSAASRAKQPKKPDARKTENKAPKTPSTFDAALTGLATFEGLNPEAKALFAWLGASNDNLAAAIRWFKTEAAKQLSGAASGKKTEPAPESAIIAETQDKQAA